MTIHVDVSELDNPVFAAELLVAFMARPRRAVPARDCCPDCGIEIGATRTRRTFVCCNPTTYRPRRAER